MAKLQVSRRDLVALCALATALDRGDSEGSLIRLEEHAAKIKRKHGITMDDEREFARSLNRKAGRADLRKALEGE